MNKKFSSLNKLKVAPDTIRVRNSPFSASWIQDVSTVRDRSLEVALDGMIFWHRTDGGANPTYTSRCRNSHTHQRGGTPEGNPDVLVKARDTGCTDNPAGNTEQCARCQCKQRSVSKTDEASPKVVLVSFPFLEADVHLP